VFLEVTQLVMSVEMCAHLVSLGAVSSDIAPRVALNCESLDMGD
jgi:hypothetical protein